MSEVSEAATFHEAGHAVVALSLGFEVERDHRCIPIGKEAAELLGMMLHLSHPLVTQQRMDEEI